MFLDLTASGLPMKLVYNLRDDLKSRPGHVALVQGVTMDPRKPLIGLRGAHGLFASEEWWESIRTGRIATKMASGSIVELLFEGQESRWGDEVNSFRLELGDGLTRVEPILANHRHDRKLFRVGATVWMVHAMDELKRPAPDGTTSFGEILLELAVSLSS